MRKEPPNKPKFNWSNLKRFFPAVPTFKKSTFSPYSSLLYWLEQACQTQTTLGAEEATKNAEGAAKFQKFPYQATFSQIESLKIALKCYTIMFLVLILRLLYKF